MYGHVAVCARLSGEVAHSLPRPCGGFGRSVVALVGRPCAVCHALLGLLGGFGPSCLSLVSMYYVLGASSGSGIAMGSTFSITLRVLITHVILSLGVELMLQFIGSSADRGCMWVS